MQLSILAPSAFLILLRALLISGLEFYCHKCPSFRTNKLSRLSSSGWKTHKHLSQSAWMLLAEIEWKENCWRLHMTSETGHSRWRTIYSADLFTKIIIIAPLSILNEDLWGDLEFTITITISSQNEMRVTKKYLPMRRWDEKIVTKMSGEI